MSSPGRYTSAKSPSSLSVADKEHIVWSNAANYSTISNHTRGAAVSNEASSADAARVSNRSAIKMQAGNGDIVGSSRATSEARSNTSAGAAIDNSDGAPASINGIAVVEILEPIPNSIRSRSAGSPSPSERKIGHAAANIESESRPWSTSRKSATNSKDVRRRSTPRIKIAMIVDNGADSVVRSGKSSNNAKEQWPIQRVGPSRLAKNSNSSNGRGDSPNQPPSRERMAKLNSNKINSPVRSGYTADNSPRNAVDRVYSDDNSPSTSSTAAAKESTTGIKSSANSAYTPPNNSGSRTTTSTVSPLAPEENAVAPARIVYHGAPRAKSMSMEASNSAYTVYPPKAPTTLNSNSPDPARSMEIAKEADERNVRSNGRKASNGIKAYNPPGAGPSEYSKIGPMVSANARTAVENAKSGRSHVMR